MSIVVRYGPASLTTEQYDEAVRRHEEAGIALPPDGMDYHVCFGSDGDLRVSEIRDSREQLEAYGARLMPILADVGIEAGEPEVFEVHNIIRR
jgi:glycine/D-amino acid oxidase-like deaminating enzyme